MRLCSLAGTQAAESREKTGVEHLGGVIRPGIQCPLCLERVKNRLSGERENTQASQLGRLRVLGTLTAPQPVK